MATFGTDVLIFDHDGTLTDIHGYEEAFAEELRADFPFLGDTALERLRLIMGEIRLDPERTVRIANTGPDSGRAGADMLLTAQMAAKELLLTHHEALSLVHQRLPDEKSPEAAITTYLTTLHHKYKKTAATYREGLEELFERLMGKAVVYVVTNSGTREVCEALKSWHRKDVGIWLAERVIGGAMKFKVDADATEDGALQIPGIKRPVYTSRSTYRSILESILQREGLTAERVTVVGDILEFDLLLPLQMGMNGVLVGKDAFAYEVTYMDSHPRGRFVPDLQFLTEMYRLK